MEPEEVEPADVEPSVPVAGSVVDPVAPVADSVVSEVPDPAVPSRGPAHPAPPKQQG